MTPQTQNTLCICGKTGCRIPYGLCHCRCGEKAPIALFSDPRHGYVKGKPKSFILNHHRRVRPILEDAHPFKIDGVYCRLISLTQGQYAIIDSADYEWLMQWKWFAKKAKNYGYYAERNGVGLDGNRITVRMNRQILGLEYGEDPEGDHKNGNRLDNRRKNLRPTDHAGNTQNSATSVSNTSGRKGLSKYQFANKFQVEITARKKKIYLGVHHFEEACAIREAAEIKYHGEFVRK